ncbi:SPOR domain-containing protein [Ramlibacter sp. AN1133]|uniref:SPOR domain-containing protein n=1 Tax=Ramlibacter sp. AN1133 TaxID=3133429 RepID=UPI0030C42F1A
MALFKLRKKVDAPKAASSPAESIEVMRRRARHRLIGAVVLVLAGVVGFPLLFDTQPRPVAVDIPIEIPDRNKAKPLPPLPQAPAPAVSGKVASAPAPAPVITESRQEAGLPATEGKPAPAAAAKAEPPKVAKAESVPEKKPEPRAETRTETKPEAAKAQALLEGKSVDTAAGGLRYVVQVGAFAEKEKAKLAQQKLDRAGLKNYTNIAETKNGPRIRVRAGPFASRAEADRAAEKIKGLALPAAILSL